MNTPTISDMRGAGYRMSANAANEIVGRCAQAVKRDYLLHYVEEQDITDAQATDAIGRCWLSLTYVSYMQQVEFGTRTGGEKKRFEFGEHLEDMEAAKADAAANLRELEQSHPCKSKVVDTCRIYFKSQIFG